MIKAAAGGKDITELIGVATSVIEAAGKLAEKGSPLISDPAIEFALHKAGKAVAKAGAKKDSLLNAFREAKDEKALKKLIEETRQAVLEGAPTKVEIYKLLENLESGEELSGFAAVIPFDYCGCYAIITYMRRGPGKNLADYVGVFVGRGENVGQSILKDISRDGNPDVYADVKYKQSVHVYIYNCRSEELEEKYESLCKALQAQKSYNF